MIINGKRALAYVVNVDELKPIFGYDRVEYARTNGWWCVVKINELKVGDKAVYFEIDSQVPKEDKRFSFLESKHYKIKTQKMCKVYSQGLLMPISLFPEINDKQIGDDVTEILGVKYYVEEDNERKNTQQDLAQKFPTYFPYINITDEERIENMPWVLDFKKPFIVTEKLDGCSSTYILVRRDNDFEFYVLSRNIRQKFSEEDMFLKSNIYWEMAYKYDIENKLKKYIEDNPELTYVCIQGESVGKPQGNPLKLKNNDLYIFNFIRSDIGRVSYDEGKLIVENLGMKFVPILETKYYLPNSMDVFKEYATGKSVINSEVLREGIVLRNQDLNLSFKNISREYLLKH